MSVEKWELVQTVTITDVSSYRVGDIVSFYQDKVAVSRIEYSSTSSSGAGSGKPNLLTYDIQNDQLSLDQEYSLTNSTDASIGGVVLKGDGGPNGFSWSSPYYKNGNNTSAGILKSIGNNDYNKTGSAENESVGSQVAVGNIYSLYSSPEKEIYIYKGGSLVHTINDLSSNLSLSYQYLDMNDDYIIYRNREGEFHVRQRIDDTTWNIVQVLDVNSIDVTKLLGNVPSNLSNVAMIFWACCISNDSSLIMIGVNYGSKLLSNNDTGYLRNINGVLVYKKNGSTWTHVSFIETNDIPRKHIRLNSTGNTLLIGSQRVHGIKDTGSLLYKKNDSNDDWTFLQYIKGEKSDISGNYIVSSFFNDKLGSKLEGFDGEIYLYKLNSNASSNEIVFDYSNNYSANSTFSLNNTMWKSTGAENFYAAGQSAVNRRIIRYGDYVVQSVSSIYWGQEEEHRITGYNSATTTFAFVYKKNGNIWERVSYIEGVEHNFIDFYKNYFVTKSGDDIKVYKRNDNDEDFTLKATLSKTDKTLSVPSIRDNFIIAYDNTGLVYFEKSIDGSGNEIWTETGYVSNVGNTLREYVLYENTLCTPKVESNYTPDRFTYIFTDISQNRTAPAKYTLIINNDNLNYDGFGFNDNYFYVPDKKEDDEAILLYKRTNTTWSLLQTIKDPNRDANASNTFKWSSTYQNELSGFAGNRLFMRNIFYEKKEEGGSEIWKPFYYKYNIPGEYPVNNTHFAFSQDGTNLLLRMSLKKRDNGNGRIQASGMSALVNIDIFEDFSPAEKAKLQSAGMSSDDITAIENAVVANNSTVTVFQGKGLVTIQKRAAAIRLIFAKNTSITKFKTKGKDMKMGRRLNKENYTVYKKGSTVTLTDDVAEDNGVYSDISETGDTVTFKKDANGQEITFTKVEGGYTATGSTKVWKAGQRYTVDGVSYYFD